MDFEFLLIIGILGEKKCMKDKIRGDYLIFKYVSLFLRMGFGWCVVCSMYLFKFI